MKKKKEAKEIGFAHWVFSMSQLDRVYPLVFYFFGNENAAHGLASYTSEFTGGLFFAGAGKKPVAWRERCIALTANECN